MSDTLTPEELRELELLRKQQEPTEDAPLSPEEMQELARLRSEQDEPELEERPVRYNPKDNPHPARERHATDEMAQDATLQGMGRALTFNHLPYLQAAGEQALDSTMGALGLGPAAEDKKLRQQGFSVPQTSFGEKAEAFEARQGRLREQRPEAFGGGELTGDLALTALLNPATKKAASSLSALPGLGKLFQTAKPVTEAAKAAPGFWQGAEELLKQSAQGAAQGYATGFLNKPEGAEGLEARHGQAKMTAAVGGALPFAAEGLRQTWRGVKGLGERAGKALAGFTDAEARLYQNQPELVEHLRKLHNNKKEFHEFASREVADAQRALYDKTAPDRAIIEKAVAGENTPVRVNPADFKGTAAEADIQRIWAAQSGTKGLSTPTATPPLEHVEFSPLKPKFERAGKVAKASPLIPTMKLGPGLKQHLPADYAGYSMDDAPSMTMFELKRGWEKKPKTVPVMTPLKQVTQPDGPTQLLGTHFSPQGKQTIHVTRPTPEDISLTKRQALDLNRKLNDAANYRHVINTEETIAQQKVNQAGATRLQKGLEGVMDPESWVGPRSGKVFPSQRQRFVEAKERASEAAHWSDALKNNFHTNPASLFYESTAAGDVKLGALREVIDQARGNTRIQDLTTALGAALASERGSTGGGTLSKRMAAPFFAPMGRAALTSAHKLDSALAKPLDKFAEAAEDPRWRHLLLKQILSRGEEE